MRYFVDEVTPGSGLEMSGKRKIALVLGGGGARSAYQAGFLRYIGKRIPDFRFSILCGTSAGAINAVHLARHQGSLAESSSDLKKLWSKLTVDQVRIDLRVIQDLLRGVPSACPRDESPYGLLQVTFLTVY